LRRLVFSSSGDPSASNQVADSKRGRAVASFLTEAAQGVFTALFPSNCRLCNAPLVNISRLPVCDLCLESIKPIEGPVCAVCGEHRLSPHVAAEGEICPICLQAEPPFAKAAAYGSYQGGLRDLIHLLKYQNVRPAANVLGRMLADVIAGLAPFFAAGNPLLVPVPLHAVKLRQRGFNQSELIAHAAIKMRPAGLELELNPKVLVRKRATGSQTGLTQAQRRQNVRGAFALPCPNVVTGRDILVVDDVFTTGTTVSECARVLRRGGAERVWVATVARVLKAEATFVELPEVYALSEEGQESEPLTMAARA
jgi:ComF family protein